MNLKKEGCSLFPGVPGTGRAQAGPTTIYQLMARVVEVRRAGLSLSGGSPGRWVALTAAGATDQVLRDEVLARQLEEQERRERQVDRSRSLSTRLEVIDLTEEEEEEEEKSKPQRQERGGRGRKVSPAETWDLL